MTLYPLAFMNLQWPELMMILFIALLVFGKRLPEVARSLGRGVSEFKAGLRDTVEDFDAPPAAAPRSEPVKPLPPPHEPVSRNATEPQQESEREPTNAVSDRP